MLENQRLVRKEILDIEGRRIAPDSAPCGDGTGRGFAGANSGNVAQIADLLEKRRRVLAVPTRCGHRSTTQKIKNLRYDRASQLGTRIPARH